MRRPLPFIATALLLIVLIAFMSMSGVITVRRATAPAPAAPEQTLTPRTPPPPQPSPPPPSAAGLVIPVEGVRPEDLQNTFNDARSQGRSHDAIDILAPKGTRVLAAAPGKLLRLFTSERGGLTLYILGDDGRTVYYYAHLDGYAPGLAEGQPIRQGQHVGFVGDTGNAVPGNHHLHFAIWTVSDPEDFWEGPNQNPYPLLGGR